MSIYEPSRSSGWRLIHQQYNWDASPSLGNPSPLVPICSPRWIKIAETVQTRLQPQTFGSKVRAFTRFLKRLRQRKNWQLCNRGKTDYLIDTWDLQNARSDLTYFGRLKTTSMGQLCYNSVQPFYNIYEGLNSFVNDCATFFHVGSAI